MTDFINIVSATSDTKVDIDGNSLIENMFEEIPELKYSTIDVMINTDISQYHLLWPEQEVRESIVQSYSLVGRINQFTVDSKGIINIPSSSNENKSDILAAPVDMVLLEDNIISCKMIREMITPKGKVMITFVAKYQKDQTIQRK